MGLETLTASDANTFDILIIGGGPAGLTAAIYGCKANLKVGFIEQDVPGGKIVNLPKITNYPGYPAIAGADLALNMYTQATEAGAIYIYGKVTGIIQRQNYHVAFLENGVNYFAKALIIATGTTETKLNIPGANEYKNKGVSYCAVCDGALTKNKDVVVLGNNDIAVQDAIYLSGIANKVYLLINEPKLNVPDNVIDVLNKNKKIQLIHSAKCLAIQGDQEQITSIDIEVNQQKQTINVSYVFSFIGSHTGSDFLTNLHQVVDADGIIIVDQNKQTKVKGIFAAGDVIKKYYRQITTAVGDGTLAALSAIKYLKNNANF
jgi:thioredoxin reductase (NADPH)